MAEGVTLTTGVGVTLSTGEGVGGTLTRGVAVGEGVSVAFAPAAWYGSKQSAVDEATAIRITKDSPATREMRILDPPACNDNY
ncbi:MAG: hypothetical protein ACXV2A_02165 [Halobacteriota archaeon]